MGLRLEGARNWRTLNGRDEGLEWRLSKQAHDGLLREIRSSSWSSAIEHVVHILDSRLVNEKHVGCWWRVDTDQYDERYLQGNDQRTGRPSRGITNPFLNIRPREVRPQGYRSCKSRASVRHRDVTSGPIDRYHTKLTYCLSCACWVGQSLSIKQSFHIQRRRFSKITIRQYGG